jgi:tetrapyrrole methylase family protein/MazG family protein
MDIISSNKDNYTFEDLLEIIKILRSEDGCPWDRVQTHESLKSNTIEECYEVVEAINNQDVDNLKEELGDVLLHVVFHSKIAEDNKQFNIDDVIDGISKKLIRRHPHVFADDQVSDATEVLIKWEEIKKQEKNNIEITDDIDNIPIALPALMRAAKVQKKAAKVGFDFANVRETLLKVKEETKELEMAIEAGSDEAIEEEFGDLLFSVVNMSRFLGLNAEISLTNATKKFINRFRGINQIALEKNESLEDLSIDEMNELWETYKRDNSNHNDY